MIKTFDVLEAVVEEATSQFAPNLVLSAERMAEMKNVCKLVDFVIKDFDCDAYEVDTDIETASVMISVECMDIVMENGDSHPFFKLIREAKMFTLKNVDKESMRLTFFFDKIWIPA